MKRNLVLLLTCLFGLSAFAQEDPVLMRINGKDITRSEFEYIYNKNNSLNELEAKSLNEYVDLFINFKLKVAAAEAAGIDTTRAFREELNGYRRQLAKSYLTDEEADEAYARQFYDKMKADSRAGHVQVMHIFKYLPQTSPKPKPEWTLYIRFYPLIRMRILHLMSASSLMIKIRSGWVFFKRRKSLRM